MVQHHLVVRVCTAAPIIRPPRPGSHRREGSIPPVGSGLATPVPVGQGLVSGLSDDEMDGSPQVHVHATQQNFL